MKKSLKWLFAACAALAVAFTGCGGNSDDDEDEETVEAVTDVELYSYYAWDSEKGETVTNELSTRSVVIELDKTLDASKASSLTIKTKAASWSEAPVVNVAFLTSGTLEEDPENAVSLTLTGSTVLTEDVPMTAEDSSFDFEALSATNELTYTVSYEDFPETSGTYKYIALLNTTDNNWGWNGVYLTDVKATVQNDARTSSLTAATADTANTLAKDLSTTVYLYTFDAQNGRDTVAATNAEYLANLAELDSTVAAYEATYNDTDAVMFKAKGRGNDGSVRVNYIFDQSTAPKITEKYYLSANVSYGSNVTILFYDTKEDDDGNTIYDSEYLDWFDAGAVATSLKDYAGKTIRGIEFSAGSVPYYITDLAIDTDHDASSTFDIQITSIKIDDVEAMNEDVGTSLTLTGVDYTADNKYLFNIYNAYNSEQQFFTMESGYKKVEFTVVVTNTKGTSYPADAYLDVNCDWTVDKNIKFTGDGTYTFIYEWDEGQKILSFFMHYYASGYTE